MRRAFADTLTRVAKTDPSIAFITGDLGFQVFDEFEKQFPGRYINAGVAEAQMIYTAAGMAVEGYRPIAYSIASFATGRPFEQIRYCIAYPKLPVMLVGAGRGYLYSTSGVSHHAGDDLGLMSILPGMTVVAPGDPVEINELMPQLLKIAGPSYFTVGKFGEPTYTAEEPAVLGKARLLRKGERVAILTTGEIANEALKAIEDLKSSGVHPVVYQYHTIKPLDTDTLDALAEQVASIIVVEEHVPNGGLWAAVSQYYGKYAINFEQPPHIYRLGVPDQFILGNLKQAELRRRYKFDASAIAELTQTLWNGKTGVVNSSEQRPAPNTIDSQGPGPHIIAGTQNDLRPR